ncbi:DUF6517 family protein [Haladaptatus salinisoli]|uniref:DUF6517 family protein n=1 Tax=Haladaptatus salinisoli TaxID=2884876 RepID=UPI001D09F8AB|nr:DUF6517 family protein [Haladaptatus salinisoli]
MARKILAGAFLAVLVLSSGCLGFILGDSLAFSANKATVGNEALSGAGYEKASVERKTAKRTFEAAGQSREVKVTNWVAQYEKSVGVSGIAEGTVSKFVVISSPKVEVAGKTFNPLAKYDDRKLVERFVSGYANVDDLRKTGSKRVTMLGTKTEVSEFTTTAKSNGATIEVSIHVAKVKHGDDIVVAMAIYPKQLDESEGVYRLVEGVEHEK